MKRFRFVALCLALCLGLCACDGDREASQSPTSDQAGNTPTQEVTATAEPTPEPKTEYGVGERAELKDVAVTLTEVEESTGAQFFAPEEGKVFLLCHFDIDNGSDKDLAVSSMLSFDAYVDDYTVSQSLGAVMASDAGQLDGTVAAGKKMAGVIGYEVAADWSEVEITFTPDVWSGKGLTFIAQHQ